eukprot:m51a1_g348 hypothetical protein (290) ;mRNA; f:545174-546167
MASRSIFVLVRGEPIEVVVQPNISGSRLKQAVAEVLSRLSMLPDSSRSTWGLVVAPFTGLAEYVVKTPIPPDKPNVTRRLVDPRAKLDDTFFIQAAKATVTLEMFGSWPFTPEQSASGSAASGAPAASASAAAAPAPGGAGTGQYSKLATAKNIREFETKKAENLQRIAKAAGIEGAALVFEIVDPEGVHTALAQRGYENRTGEALFDWYLGALATNLEKTCADQMTRDTVKAALTQRKVLFRLNPKCKSEAGKGSWEFFENGALVIEVKPTDLCSNITTCGASLESVL